MVRVPIWRACVKPFNDRCFFPQIFQSTIFLYWNSYLGLETHIEVDLFSLYVLFSHFRPRDVTRENCFFQIMHTVCIINERQLANSVENVTRSKLGKQNIQAKKVYYFLVCFFLQISLRNHVIRVACWWSILQTLNENRVSGEKHFFTNSPYDRRNVKCKPVLSLHMKLIATKTIIVMKRSDANKASPKTMQP